MTARRLARARRWAPLLAVATVAIGGARAAGPAPRLIARHPCPGIPGFACASLLVPLDPSGEVPGRLRLRVALARGPAPRGVLVYLPGGPGQAGIDLVPRIRQHLGRVLTGYRLVVFDPRGTGATALECPALQRAVGASDLTVPPTRAVAACAAHIGPDRRFYATAETVADLEALRRALSSPRLSLFGGSYGAYVAERYALAHPRRVARMVLDSVVPEQGVDLFSRASMRATGRVLSALCVRRGPPGCARDPRAEIETILARFPGQGPPLLDAIVGLGTQDPSFAGLLPALGAAAQGRIAPLELLERRVRRFEAVPASFLSQGLHASAVCADARPPWGSPAAPLARRRRALARAAARLTPSQVEPFDRATALGNGLLRTCFAWPPEPLPAPAAGGVLPRVPILILAGGRDLSTPLEWAEQQAAPSPSARLLVFPELGHAVLATDGSGRALAAVDRFLHASP